MTVDRLHELDQNPAERARTFQQVMLDGVERWMNMAAEKLAGTKVRCFVSPGNDDEVEVDDVIRQAKAVELVEGRAVDIDGLSMISTGWAHPKPWKTNRHAAEASVTQRNRSV